MDASSNPSNQFTPEEELYAERLRQFLLDISGFRVEANAPHSPGPWAVKSEATVYIDGPEFGLYPSCVEENHGSYERMVADSYLIAAAPDLLAAIKGLMEGIKRAHENGIDTGIGVGNAYAAIDKAEFREPKIFPRRAND